MKRKRSFGGACYSVYHLLFIASLMITVYLLPSKGVQSNDQQQTPPYTVGLDDKVIYNAIEMPDKNLSKDVTKGQFRGRFWLDGLTSLATDSAGETYLWVYATVHSPQLPSGSKLSWFA